MEKKVILKDIDAVFKPGTTTLVLGPPGCGKVRRSWRPGTPPEVHSYVPSKSKRSTSQENLYSMSVKHKRALSVKHNAPFQ